MLSVGLFVAFWVIVAVALIYVAMRGGLGGARASLHRQTYAANRFVLVVFILTVVIFGVGLPLAMLVGNHANASAKVGGMQLNANEKTGRQLFGEHCGVCHTLEASNSVGKVGPNLDLIKPSGSLTLHTILNGCLPNAPSGSSESCLGYGVMPADVVTGHAAQQVAAFVSKVAGQE